MDERVRGRDQKGLSLANTISLAIAMDVCMQLPNTQVKPHCCLVLRFLERW